MKRFIPLFIFLCPLMLLPLFAQNPVKPAPNPVQPDSAKPAEPSADQDASKTAAEENRFIRHVEVGRRAQLQTSVIRYKKKKVTVDLIGAVHIGDAKYYDKLNELFKNYDVLLYELVAPGDEEIGELQKAQMKQIRGSQQAMQKALGLEFQMTGVDYDPENFVHADMNMDEFIKEQKRQGESFFKLYMQTASFERKRQLSGQTTGSLDVADLGGLVLSPNRSMSLRLLLSRQLADLGGQFDQLDNSVIIAGRNIKAFEVLDRELKEGHKRIGIFYGAGHMPDMEERLLDKGFKRKKVDWLSCWNMYVP